MAQYEPPPTYADPVIVDEKSGKSQFNPIWLKWFVDFAQVLTQVGATSGGIQHNNLQGLQGGSAGERYHLTGVVATNVTDLSGNWTAATKTLQVRVVQPDTAHLLNLEDRDGGVQIQIDINKLGFFGTGAVVKPTITGSRGGNAALESLLTELAALGLLVDGTTA